MLRFIASVCLGLSLMSAASAQAVIYGTKVAPSCDGKGACTVALGSAGALKLPALIAIKSAHSHYLSSSPPNGGWISLSDHVKHWEEWDMITVGDKVAFQSHHGTFLSQAFHPADGFTLAAERLGHELFTVEEKGADNQISMKGHNGMWVSARDGGLRQEFASMDWETWTVEQMPSGKVALKSAHGTYLAASAPDTFGKISQQQDISEWETFVVDQVGRNHVSIETSHSTFIGAHADAWHPEKLITSEGANLWEMWTPFVNTTNGKVCFQGHDGRFMYANEDTWQGWGLADHCMEHEQVEVVAVTEQMLADGRRASDERRAKHA